MTDVATTAMAPAVARATRGVIMRMLVVAGLMAAGYGACVTLERALHLTFDKPPMPLTKPLSEMAKQLGTRYVAEGPDEVMDDETVEVLGTKDYLLRTYTDLTKHNGEPGSTLKLNLNYYATGNASPHVPEICWAGVGMNEASSSRRYFDVPNVRRKDGSLINLRMRMISFLPQQGVGGIATGTSKESSELLNVAYTFEVNGSYVATPQEVSSLFWRASAKHAYHCKVEVTVAGPGGHTIYCTQDEAIKAISDFIREALPEVEECLPTPDAAEGVKDAVAGEKGSTEAVH